MIGLTSSNECNDVRMTRLRMKTNAAPPHVDEHDRLYNFLVVFFSISKFKRIFNDCTVRIINHLRSINERPSITFQHGLAGEYVFLFRVHSKK